MQYRYYYRSSRISNSKHIFAADLISIIIFEISSSSQTKNRAPELAAIFYYLDRLLYRIIVDF